MLRGRRIVIVLQIEFLAGAAEMLGVPQAVDGAAPGGAEGLGAGPPAALQPAPAPAPTYGGGGGYGAPAVAHAAPAYGQPPQAASGYGQQGPAAPGAYGGRGAGARALLAPNYAAGGGAVAHNDNGTRLSLLSELNLYANRWTVKVRITSKGDIKKFHNDKGEGKLCTFDIMDEVRPWQPWAVARLDGSNHWLLLAARAERRADAHGWLQRRGGQVLRPAARGAGVHRYERHSPGGQEGARS